MAEIKLGENTVHTSGNLPEVGGDAPDATLVAQDLSEVVLSSYTGKRVVLNIFPSIDTGVCAASVRKFNEEAAGLDNTVVVNVSVDLPFALKRFCGAEGIENAVSLSAFRHDSFENGYGVTMIDGKMKGFFSRAVVVVDEKGDVLHTEQVPQIGQEPNYEAALAILS
ncbi:MAG: thiol peroxidase [Flavobacteriales bacterium]|nr:thiol peroxidase [Flavobacteriales bacterium]